MALSVEPTSTAAMSTRPAIASSATPAAGADSSAAKPATPNSATGSSAMRNTTPPITAEPTTPSPQRDRTTPAERLIAATGPRPSSAMTGTTKNVMTDQATLI